MEVTRQLGFRYLDRLFLHCTGRRERLDARIPKYRASLRAPCAPLLLLTRLTTTGTTVVCFCHGTAIPWLSGLGPPYDKTPLAALSRRVFKRESPVCVWKLRWLAPPTADSDENTVIIRPRAVSLYSRVRKSEWFRRCWAFQGRVLSRRIIYYAKEKLYWSCFEATGDEEGRDPVAPSRTFWFAGETRNGRWTSNIWKTILADYVSCSLTYAKDRLVALGDSLPDWRRTSHATSTPAFFMTRLSQVKVCYGTAKRRYENSMAPTHRRGHGLL